MDNATLSIMEKPRCGMKDEVKDAKLSRRKRRWALQGEIWDLSKKRKVSSKMGFASKSKWYGNIIG